MGQDYILRLIQQIMAMVASIMARRQRGDLAGAAAEIEEHCARHVGLPLVVVRQTSPEALLALLSLSGARGQDRALMLGELLLQAGGVAELQGNPLRAVEDYRLAQALLAASVEILDAADAPAYEAKIDWLATKLRDLGDDSRPARPPAFPN